MKTNHHAILGLAISLAAAMTLAVGLDDTSRPPMPGATEQVEDTQVTALTAESRATEQRIAVRTTAPDTGAWSAAVGSAFRFSVGSSTTVEVHQESGHAVPPLVQRLAAQLDFAVRGRRGDELLVSMAMTDIELEIPGKAGAGSDVLREFAAGFAGETLVRMRDDGTTLGYRFPSGMDAVQEHGVRSIVDALRHVLPEGRAARWRTDEACANAVGRFDYAATTESGATRLERRLLGFAGGDCTPERPWTTTGSGEATSVFDHELGWLRLTESRQDLVVAVPQMRSAITTSTAMALRLESCGRSAERCLGDEAWDGPWAPVTADHDPRAMGRASFARSYRESLAGETAGGFVQRISAMLAGGTGLESKDLRTELKRFRWLLRVDPSQVAFARRMMLDAVHDHVLLSMLADVLAAAGTPACQAALCELLALPELDLASRQVVARAMLYLTAPTADALATAAGLAASAEPGLCRTGLILYGALVRQLSSDSAHVASLAALEEHAEQLGILADWLLALGNAQHPVLDQIAERHLSARDPAIRRAAIQALTHVRDDEHTRRLRALLAGESTAELESLLVEELALRNDVATIVGRMRVADDAGVRRTALLAARHLIGDRRVRATVERIARSDESRELRELAHRLLANG